MMRKILKRIGIVLGGLVGLLLLAFAVLYIIGTVKWNSIRGHHYDVPVEKISIPTDQASIARGEHIATIRVCKVCHTETLSGQFDSVPGLITFAFPNLTPGAGGVGAANTDEDWVRAIRHGVGHDGRGLILMPSRAWYYLSDDDLADLIAYLKTLPPVDNELPKTDLGPLGRVMMALGQLPPDATAPDVLVIDHDAPRPVAPQPGVTVEYGKYLALQCALCHGVNFNGQTIRTDAEYFAPNLTPGGELHYWSEADFMRTLRTGVTP
ncbi:MAG TPA: cytochrome c, partial [Anaerolineales bacterium]|nr:cytochrome c [Anaerolineales bacterium]